VKKSDNGHSKLFLFRLHKSTHWLLLSRLSDDNRRPPALMPSRRRNDEKPLGARSIPDKSKEWKKKEKDHLERAPVLA
jgi:hypothetical protein